MLIIIRCAHCRRLVRFLASDLIEVLGDPFAPADRAPFECSQCRRRDWLSVTLHSPAPGDVGHLVVRRPGPVRKIRTWRSVKLGD
jgi:hypothetical protein